MRSEHLSLLNCVRDLAEAVREIADELDARSGDVSFNPESPVLCAESTDDWLAEALNRPQQSFRGREADGGAAVL